MVSFNIEAKNGVILDTFGNYNPENNGCTFSDELVSPVHMSNVSILLVIITLLLGAKMSI